MASGELACEAAEWLNILLDFVKSLISGAVGGLIVWGVSAYWDKKQRAVLCFRSEPLVSQFRESRRVMLVVEHQAGNRPATNALGYVTIKVGKERGIPPEIVVPKKKQSHLSLRGVEERGEGEECELKEVCNKCNEKTYLVPYEQATRIDVYSDALPWTLSIEAGKGLDDLPLRHLTHIPVGGTAKLLLFDIYRVEVVKMDKGGGKVVERLGEYYLLKVHSEYGDTYYPRVCIKLPVPPPCKDKQLLFEVTVTGENVREAVKTSVRISWDDKAGDYKLSHRGWSIYFNDLLREAGSLKERRYPDDLLSL